MIKLIKVEDRKAVINDNVLLIDEFAKLHEEYMKRDPSGDLLSKALCTLFYLYDPESPYIYLHEIEREEKVREDFRHKDFKPSQDPIFIRAKQKAEALYSTPTKRLLVALKASMDKISDYLLLQEITSGKDGNFAEILRLHKESHFILKNFKAAEADFYKETQKNRGNTISAIDEDDINEDF